MLLNDQFRSISSLATGMKTGSCQYTRCLPLAISTDGRPQSIHASSVDDPPEGGVLASDPDFESDPSRVMSAPGPLRASGQRGASPRAMRKEQPIVSICTTRSTIRSGRLEETSLLRLHPPFGRGVPAKTYWRVRGSRTSLTAASQTPVRVQSSNV